MTVNIVGEQFALYDVEFDQQPAIHEHVDIALPIELVLQTPHFFLGPS